jgi:hypothetical protein
MRLHGPLLLALAAVAPAAERTGLAAVQQLLAVRTAQDARMLEAADLDRDRKLSQVEAVLFLYGRQAVARRQAPEAFALLDGDGDRAISSGEFLAFLARDPQPGLSAAERRSSILGGQRGAAGGAMGSSVGVGGSAYVFFGSQQAYIQDYDVVNGQYDPVIGVLGSGVVLEVSGVSVTIRRGGR